MRRLIYSKQYPKEDIELPKGKGCDDGSTPASWEKMKEKIAQRTTYREIPGRRHNSSLFIDIATEVSETYEYDIEIYETDILVEVLLSFDSHSTSGALNQLFRMADDFSFFAGIKNREITISMDYYIAAVCRDGKQIMPDNSYYSREGVMPERYYFN